MTIVDGRLSQIHAKRMSSFGHFWTIQVLVLSPFSFADRLLSQTGHYHRPPTSSGRLISQTVHFRIPSTFSRLDRFSLLTFYSDVTWHALRIRRFGTLTKIVSYWPFVYTQFAIFISNCTFPIIKTFSRSRNFSSIT